MEDLKSLDDSAPSGDLNNFTKIDAESYKEWAERELARIRTYIAGAMKANVPLQPVNPTTEQPDFLQAQFFRAPSSIKLPPNLDRTSQVALYIAMQVGCLMYH